MGWINWNGISVAIEKPMEDAALQIKQKRTTIYIVAGIIALGIILFIRKK